MARQSSTATSAAFCPRPKAAACELRPRMAVSFSRGFFNRSGPDKEKYLVDESLRKWWVYGTAQKSSEL